MLVLLDLLGGLGINEEMRSFEVWVICLSLVRPSKHLQVHCISTNNGMKLTPSRKDTHPTKPTMNHGMVEWLCTSSVVEG
jgi:hypothetical protein